MSAQFWPLKFYVKNITSIQENGFISQVGCNLRAMWEARKAFFPHIHKLSVSDMAIGPTIHCLLTTRRDNFFFTWPSPAFKFFFYPAWPDDLSNGTLAIEILHVFFNRNVTS